MLPTSPKKICKIITRPTTAGWKYPLILPSQFSVWRILRRPAVNYNLIVGQFDSDCWKPGHIVSPHIGLFTWTWDMASQNWNCPSQTGHPSTQLNIGLCIELFPRRLLFPHETLVLSSTKKTFFFFIIPWLLCCKLLANLCNQTYRLIRKQQQNVTKRCAICYWSKRCETFRDHWTSIAVLGWIITWPKQELKQEDTGPSTCQADFILEWNYSSRLTVTGVY